MSTSTRATQQGEKPTRNARGDGQSASPNMHQQSPEIQSYGTLRDLPIGLDARVRTESCGRLNQILADTISLRELYQKHHWQVAGPTFYQLHLLYEKHYNEQAALVDEIAERIRTLGGVSIAMSHDVAEMTRIKRPPRGVEEVPVQISRLLEAHELIIKEVREAADDAGEAGDAGTEDLLVSSVLRTNELQVWFVSEHVVGMDLVMASR